MKHNFGTESRGQYGKPGIKPVHISELPCSPEQGPAQTGVEVGPKQEDWVKVSAGDTVSGVPSGTSPQSGDFLPSPPQ